MAKYSKGPALDKDDKEWFSRQYKGLTANGDTVIKEWVDDGIERGSTKVVFTGRWTPYGCIRDCGDHYIEALYSSYRWISKDFQTIKEDVEDR